MVFSAPICKDLAGCHFLLQNKKKLNKLKISDFSWADQNVRMQSKRQNGLHVNTVLEFWETVRLFPTGVEVKNSVLLITYTEIEQLSKCMADGGNHIFPTAREFRDKEKNGAKMIHVLMY